MASFGAGQFARAGDGGSGAIAFRGFTGLQRALSRIGDGSQAELRRRIKDIGERIALVAAGNAPRDTGELQHSIKTSVNLRGASVYSTAVYGGAINFGAWTRHGRGPHIKRASASHYMDRAVAETSPWVDQELNAALDWVERTFMED